MIITRMIGLEPEQHELLDKIKEKTGLSKSELIRAAVDILLERNKSKVSVVLATIKIMREQTND